MPLEIERKYLVKNLPDDLGNVKGMEIRQAYICEESDQLECRIRQMGNSYYLTFKKGAGLVREEVEITISGEEFDHLWNMANTQVISKTRYKLPHGGQIIELDLFKGRWTGLQLAEIEFKSIQESNAFMPPPWFGQEVTDNPEYRSRNLARK